MDNGRGQEKGLLILRLALGVIFVLHGWMNVVGGQAAFLRAMLEMVGWSAPDLVVWLITALELLGGVALVIGLFTRAAALMLAIEMIVAMALFFVRGGVFIIAVPNVPLAYAFEYPLALVGGLMCLVLGGPGSFALKDRLKVGPERLRSGQDDINLSHTPRVK